MRVFPTSLLPLSALVLQLALGCGGSKQSPGAEAPLTAQQVALFEDGVDMLADPTALLWAANPHVDQREVDQVRGLLGARLDRIEGQRVYLSDGPPAGTAVVTVGATEVYGTELEIAEK